VSGAPSSPTPSIIPVLEGGSSSFLGSPSFEGGDTEPGLCDLALKTCDAVLCAKCSTDYCP